MPVYKRFLNNSEYSAARKTILLKVLRIEIDEFSQVPVGHNRFFSSLRDATGKLTAVQNHAKYKDDATNKAVFSLAEAAGVKLNRVLAGSNENIAKLESQIDTLKNLKDQIETAEFKVSTPELGDATIDCIEKLITNCVEYLETSKV